MARTYRNPPLLEAICDFHFSSSQPWDWTIPGLFYEQIRNAFPFREQVATVTTTLDASQSRLVQQSQPKMQFISEDRNAVIQVAPHNLSIHQLPPYKGWMNFKASILKYWNTYTEVENHASLEEVELRYVNRIEFPFTDIDLKEYFQVLPHIPEPIPQNFSSFLFNVELPYESPSSKLRVIFGSVVPENDNKLAFVLDLNMAGSNNIVISTQQISEWLETIHERIEAAFDAAFTDKTHFEIFKEVGK